uniref:Transmembrane protein n=1 Tax=Onchocerca volvulus TaxID=6282 RepID=A0A8R1TRA0_ONCVO
MNISSQRMLNSLQRDAIKLTSSIINKQRRHLWICSQIHSRTIFFAVQILLVILSLVILCGNLDESSWRSFEYFFRTIFACAIFFAAISGIWALKLADNVHENRCRMAEQWFTSPKFIIIPSYIVQIGCIIYLAYEVFYYSIYCISYAKQSLLIVFLGVFIPISFISFVILYIFAAEIDCFMYIISRLRRSQYPASLLNRRNLNNGRLPFESVPSRNRLLPTDMLHEQKRTKTLGSDHWNPVTLDSGSKKICSNMENKIEVMPTTHAAHNMEPFYSECSRKGISVINFQLDTVPEESSKSTISLS